MDANYPAVRASRGRGKGVRERVGERNGGREGGREGKGLRAQSMSITSAPQSPLFCCSLCLPLGVAGLRVLLLVVVDVNDIFIFDGCARLIIAKELLTASTRFTARTCEKLFILLL